MEWLFNIINIPMSWVLNFLCSILGNSFAAAVAVFTLFINLAMIPLTIRSQKSSVGQMRIKPKLDELKKKYGDDKQRYSQEMQKLYQEENISPSGGCLPMIIRMLFMLSVYYLVTKPMTYLMGIKGSVIDTVWETLKASNVDYAKITDNLRELTIYREVSANPSISPEIADKLDLVNFNLFGLDLTETPKFNFDFTKAEWIWLIPIMSFAAQILTSIISMIMQKKLNPDAPSMAGMMLTMPIISLFIAVSVPGGVGFYWICSSLIGGLMQTALQFFYGPQKMLAAERAKSIVQVYTDENKYIKNRVEKATEE